MSLVYLGSLSTGVIAPSLGISLAAAIPRIQAELALQTALVAQLNLVPPSIAGSLSLAQSIVASINAAIALGVQVPSASLQISAAAALIAALNVELAALGFNLTAAGIHAYAYDGPADGLGPALPANFPGGAPTDHCNALMLTTSVPASWVALGGILKTF